MTVAQTILSQLGGGKFVVMTGAKNLADYGNALGFKIPRNKSKANYVKITLTPADLYDIEFMRLDVRTGFTVLHKVEGAYNDMLQSVFTDYTGMYTSL